MKNEIYFDIKKIIDIKDDCVIILAERIKRNFKKCSECEHCIDTISNYGYCDKHNGIVCLDDICIEVGM